MTLLQFIDSKLEEDSVIGDIARDIKRDPAFKAIKTDEERLEYLSIVTSEVSEAYDEFLDQFNSVK